MKNIVVFALIGLIWECAKNVPFINQKLQEARSLNVLEQPIIYPTQQPAEVSSVISVLQPGEETGWHKHMAPLHAYVLEGTSTMEFETNDGTQTRNFSKGDAYVGAANVWLHASNRTDQLVAVFVVFMGAKGLENTIRR